MEDRMAKVEKRPSQIPMGIGFGHTFPGYNPYQGSFSGIQNYTDVPDISKEPEISS